MIRKVFVLIASIFHGVAQHLHRISKCWLVLVAICLGLSSGCSPEDENKAREIAMALARQELTITALTINLAGTTEYEETCDNDIFEGCAFLRAHWRERYHRIAKWIGYNSARFLGRRAPDIIALQEVVSFEGCPGLFPYYMADYEALFTLINDIEIETGVRYRVAYWGAWNGICARPWWSGWSGKALLYNSDFLIYVPPIGTTWGYDSSPPEGTHILESYPCHNPSSVSLNKPCSLIDGNYWIPITSSRPKDPIFSRLRFKDSRDLYIQIFNVHVDQKNYDRSFAEIDQFVSEMEKKYADKLVYPPIIMGDFNVGSA